jgi:predicted nucleic acid-binding protein
VILYLDTSSFVPLLIGEPASERCRELWEAAAEIVSTHLLRVETFAALAQALRLGRITAQVHAQSKNLANTYLEAIAIIELDDALIHNAVAIAETHALRAYDAIHCAAALVIDDPERVAASGDQALIGAWKALGVITANTAG